MPLSEPPASLDGFPELPWAGLLYRIHRRGLSPLYFSNTGHGRFDLSPPEGTLYGSASELGSFIEVFRSTLIPMPEVEQRRLARLKTKGRLLVLADCTKAEARRFGITAAIHSTPDYALTQRWATAFRRDGFDGIVYLVSHDPSAGIKGYAIFGSSSDDLFVIDADDLIEEALIVSAQDTFGVIVVPAAGGLGV